MWKSFDCNAKQGGHCPGNQGTCERVEMIGNLRRKEESQGK